MVVIFHCCSLDASVCACVIVFTSPPLPACLSFCLSATITCFIFAIAVLLSWPSILPISTIHSLQSQLNSFNLLEMTSIEIRFTVNEGFMQSASFIFRYFLRVTLVKRISDTVKEQDIVVHTLSQYPEMNSSIKMEVGIEDCLHIEFEYNKSK